MAKQSGKIDPDVSPETYTYKYLTCDIVGCSSLFLHIHKQHTHIHTHTHTHIHTLTHVHTHIPCTHLHTQSTLDDMDMEDDMKTLVSDEIKKFRQSYQVRYC